MIAPLVSSAHRAHSYAMALHPMADGEDPLKPRKTELPPGLGGPIRAALGVGVMLFILFAGFMLLRALFDAVAAYKDGAPVSFGSIIQILVFVAIAVGGLSGLIWGIVPDGWLVSDDD